MLTNPVLFSSYDLIRKYFSQVKFMIDGEENDTHPIIELLNNPNPFQSKQDFLSEYLLFKKAYGFVYMRPMGSIGFNKTEPKTLYNLDPSCIDYNKNFSTRFTKNQTEANNAKRTPFKYREEHQEIPLSFRDVIMFFDTANGLQNNHLFCAPSRLEAIQKNIKNIDTALIAENNATSKAGLYILSGGTNGKNLGITKPLSGDEKRDIESKISQYGNAKSRGNVIATNTPLQIQSMHIPMNQLGIDKTIEHNALSILNNFGIPKDLLPLVADTGAKYENMEQAMVSMVQNTIQDEVDDFCNTLTSDLNIDQELTGSLEHLPCMQVIEDQKADKALKISQVYRNIQDNALASEILEISGINLDNEA